jgi:hypothetical protein
MCAFVLVEDKVHHNPIVATCWPVVENNKSYEEVSKVALHLELELKKLRLSTDNLTLLDGYDICVDPQRGFPFQRKGMCAVALM